MYVTLTLISYTSSEACIRPDIVCSFCCFTSQNNIYGHGGTVSSPKNNSFLLAKLEQAVNQYFVHILSLVTDNPS